MKKKTICALTLAAALAVGTSATAFAATPDVVAPNSDTEYSTTVEPRINWTGTAKLTAGTYGNITSSNNIFPDSPTIWSDANNPGTVTIRVLNSKGEQVGSTKTLAAGKKVTLDQIPAFSGTYTIQGNPTVSGTYTFTVD